MAIPNLQHEVEAARQKYPEAWRNAHTGNAQTEDFVRLLARDVRAKHGPRWGLNGKRGNPNDLSDDILAIDVVNGGAMEIIDIIAGAGGPSPSPVWNVGPGGPGDRGTFVGTFTVPDGGSVPGPSPVKPCPDPSAHVPKPPKPYPGDRVWDPIGAQLLSDMQRVGQDRLNPQSGTWWARTIWRVVNEGQTLEQSIAQSRTEWCAVLGIPVI
jgi:hypothetical protein